MRDLRNIRTLPFPENLYDECYGDIIEPINPECNARLEIAIADYLDERKQKIILKYFRDKKTLKEIGKELGVSHEAIRQSLNKALRIMRRLKFRKYIFYGEREVSEQPIVGRPTIHQMMNTSAGDYLSTRVFRALQRRGNETLYDLYVTTDEQLSQTKNLGKKGIEEIKNLRESMQIDCKHPIVEFRYCKNSDGRVDVKVYVDGIKRKLLGWECNKKVEQMPYIISEESADMDVMIVEGDYITDLVFSNPPGFQIDTGYRVMKLTVV